MSKIEETRREMYRLLAHLKENPTGVMLMGAFESAMEAHLEAVRSYYSGVIGLSYLKEQQNHELRVKLDKKSSRISQLKAWMKAAVRDNQRLRKDRKAFIETQAEHLNEIQRLSTYLDSQEGAPAQRSATISDELELGYKVRVAAYLEALQEVKP